MIPLGTNKPNARRNVPGSRLFNTIRGQVRANYKYRMVLYYDPKRLPLQCHARAVTCPPGFWLLAPSPFCSLLAPFSFLRELKPQWDR
jgi:hypothetical protein